MSGSQSQRPKAEKLTPELHPEFWYIHGKAYDLSEFIQRHPGGTRALWLTRGRDCTEMFESYHCLTDKPKQVMAKFYVGEQDDYSPMFEWNDPKVNAFGIELRAEVRKHIAENNIDIHVSNFRLAWITLLTVLAFYLMRFYWAGDNWWSIVVCPVLFWTAFVNSFHDASHFAFSKNWYLTTFYTYAWPWFSSPTTWDHEHVIAHHVYTNIHKMDPDLNHGMPIFRMHPKFKFRWIMKFQMYFVWFVWGVATLWLSNVYDFQALIVGYYHGMKSCPFVKMTKPRLAAHLFGRFCAWFFHTGIPLLLFPFWKAMFLSTTFNFFFSWCFMATTQINHLTPSSLQPAVKNSRCWAEHQVVTAQAFAHDSMFWWIFSGGLNYQIEHHLFPGINHEHLPGLKPIVQRLCKKYNIPYHYNETWSGLVEQYFEVVRRGAIAEHPGFE